MMPSSPQFPGMINGCTIDWYLPWPEEAPLSPSTSCTRMPMAAHRGEGSPQEDDGGSMQVTQACQVSGRWAAGTGTCKQTGGRHCGCSLWSANAQSRAGACLAGPLLHPLLRSLPRITFRMYRRQAHVTPSPTCPSSRVQAAVWQVTFRQQLHAFWTRVQGLAVALAGSSTPLSPVPAAPSFRGQSGHEAHIRPDLCRKLSHNRELAASINKQRPGRDARGQGRPSPH